MVSHITNHAATRTAAAAVADTADAARRKRFFSELNSHIGSTERIKDRGDSVAIREAALGLTIDLLRPVREGKVRVWRKFIYIWALREPIKIRTYCEAGYVLNSVMGMKVPKAASFVPQRCLSFCNPKNFSRDWDEGILMDIARLLSDFFGLPLDPKQGQPSIAQHKQFVETAKKLKPFGPYMWEHLFRAACVTCNKTHPSVDFIVMGTGADNTKYHKLMKMGMQNMADVNKGTVNRIDAGELAYYFCTDKFFESDFAPEAAPVIEAAALAAEAVAVVEAAPFNVLIENDYNMEAAGDEDGERSSKKPRLEDEADEDTAPAPIEDEGASIAGDPDDNRDDADDDHASVAKEEARGEDSSMHISTRTRSSGVSSLTPGDPSSDLSLSSESGGEVAGEGGRIVEETARAKPGGKFNNDAEKDGFTSFSFYPSWTSPRGSLINRRGMVLKKLTVEPIVVNGLTRYRPRTVHETVLSEERACGPEAASHATGTNIPKSEVLGLRLAHTEREGVEATDVKVKEINAYARNRNLPWKLVLLETFKKGGQGMLDLLRDQGGMFVVRTKTSWVDEVSGETKKANNAICLDTYRRYIFNSCHHGDFQCDVYDEKDLALSKKAMKEALKIRHNIDEIIEVFVVMVDTNRLAEVNHI